METRQELVQAIREAETFGDKLDAEMALSRTYREEAEEILQIRRVAGRVLDGDARRIGSLSMKLALAEIYGYDVVKGQTGRPLYCDCRECGKRYRFNSRTWQRRHYEKHHA